MSRHDARYRRPERLPCQGEGMHFVGVDLAWGERRPTGVAALDAAGRLVHVSAQTDDASIVAALAPYVEGPCLVAVDAPLEGYAARAAQALAPWRRAEVDRVVRDELLPRLLSR